ncbi:MAG: four helix bundle protein [Ignavibacteria bacterium]|nr:four helix bundle protein [Ignavibacteria bacterium]MBK9229011.1 four helix bundle protein [Ignavibacteria bacterium]
MKDNVIMDKSYDFALRTAKLYLFLREEKKEFEMSKQILRSGTSIGANVEEAIGGQSRKDFASKLGIAYKEARETKFWLRLLTDTKLITPAVSSSMLNDCEELLRILGSILKTIRRGRSENTTEQNLEFTSIPNS